MYWHNPPPTGKDTTKVGSWVAMYPLDTRIIGHDEFTPKEEAEIKREAGVDPRKSLESLSSDIMNGRLPEISPPFKSSAQYRGVPACFFIWPFCDKTFWTEKGLAKYAGGTKNEQYLYDKDKEFKSMRREGTGIPFHNELIIRAVRDQIENSYFSDDKVVSRGAAHGLRVRGLKYVQNDRHRARGAIFDQYAWWDKRFRDDERYLPGESEFRKMPFFGLTEAEITKGCEEELDVNYMIPGEECGGIVCTKLYEGQPNTLYENKKGVKYMIKDDLLPVGMDNDYDQRCITWYEKCTNKFKIGRHPKPNSRYNYEFKPNEQVHPDNPRPEDTCFKKEIKEKCTERFRAEVGTIYPTPRGERLILTDNYYDKTREDGGCFELVKPTSCRDEFRDREYPKRKNPKFNYEFKDNSFYDDEDPLEECFDKIEKISCTDAGLPREKEIKGHRYTLSYDRRFDKDRGEDGGCYDKMKQIKCNETFPSLQPNRPDKKLNYDFKNISYYQDDDPTTACFNITQKTCVSEFANEKPKEKEEGYDYEFSRDSTYDPNKENGGCFNKIAMPCSVVYSDQIPEDQNYEYYLNKDKTYNGGEENGGCFTKRSKQDIRNEQAARERLQSLIAQREEIVRLIQDLEIKIQELIARRQEKMEREREAAVARAREVAEARAREEAAREAAAARAREEQEREVVVAPKFRQKKPIGGLSTRRPVNKEAVRNRQLAVL